MKSETITVQALTGPEDVEATVCGTWAVHRALPRPDGTECDFPWSVTHVGTGRRLPWNWLNKEGAIEMAQALHVNVPVISEKPSRRVQEKINEIREALAAGEYQP